MRALGRLAIISVFGANLLPADSIVVVDLGTFGGTSSSATQISNSGMISGSSQNAAGYSHAFTTSSDGSLTDIHPAGATQSYASGVNDSGQVAGYTYINGQAHGTIWGSGGTTDLGAGSYAFAINNFGDVAGGDGQAFLDSAGTLQQLGTLAGGTWSSAYGINDSGTVVGYGNSGRAFRGFVWSPETGLTPIGTLGGLNSYAFAINSQGQVVGHSTIASGYEHAFLDQNGNLTDLGTLGGNNSYAYAINDASVVVGSSSTKGNTATHAYASTNGTMIDLNSLISPDSGWVLEQAYGINNSGDIVGSGLYNGVEHAFLLDPPQFGVPPPSQFDGGFAPQFDTTVPEPGTVGLMLGGLALFGAYRLRRR